MIDRQARWNRRLEHISTNPPESLILDEAMISHWIRDHRGYYGTTEYTGIISCL